MLINILGIRMLDLRVDYSSKHLAVCANNDRLIKCFQISLLLQKELQIYDL